MIGDVPSAILLLRYAQRPNCGIRSTFLILVKSEGELFKLLRSVRWFAADY